MNITNAFLRPWSHLLLVGACTTPGLLAEEQPASASTYRLPPPEVVAIVDAAPTPSVSLAPDGKRLLIAHSDALPSIEELSRPLLRLAGVRFHPDQNERQRRGHVKELRVLDIADGTERRIASPEGARIGSPSWSPDGARIAFTLRTEAGVELWVAEAASGAARRLVGPRLSDISGAAFDWLPGSEQLLVRLVPEGRGAAPHPPRVPSGPIVMETSGREAQNRTYQDLLANAHDEALFEHYFTSQLARVSLSGALEPLGEPGVYLGADSSPSGELLLVTRARRPWSYVVPVGSFARSIEVWDRSGRSVKVLAELPVADEVPIEGVPLGMRSVGWEPLAPATLVWVEALDGGDPRRAAEHRDRILGWRAPFDGQPTELARVRHRHTGTAWTEIEGLALVSEYDRDRRWQTTTLRRLWDPADEPRAIFDRSRHDRYGDEGTPVRKTLASGARVVEVVGGCIHLDGAGAGPEGERPFLDRVQLASGGKTRLFQSPLEAHTSFAGFAAPGADGERALLLRRESPLEPPNYHLLASGAEPRTLTSFPDPHPQLTGIAKELLRYQRADGVPLSGTLYLPPGHEPGTVLPLVVWAYPLEYTDPAVAGQVRVTTNRFTRLSGTSPLLFLTQGYAVLDNAAMPVVGDPETMNETFVEQIVAAAAAAIDAVHARGVADRERVAVGGHSYGAFMTANLLAHSDLFRAGIARSGAYNRSLTPFGFQSERRTLWQAPATYTTVSPFFQAHKIDEPLLLVHGEIDDNSGTFPIQSQRLFHAMQGLGGTARLVLLPNESHGYAARESVLHVLAESIDWLDRYVKNAPERNAGM